jgi:hypothetical protein
MESYKNISIYTTNTSDVGLYDVGVKVFLYGEYGVLWDAN